MPRPEVVIEKGPTLAPRSRSLLTIWGVVEEILKVPPPGALTAAPEAFCSCRRKVTESPSATIAESALIEAWVCPAAGFAPLQTSRAMSRATAWKAPRIQRWERAANLTPPPRGSLSKGPLMAFPAARAAAPAVPGDTGAGVRGAAGANPAATAWTSWGRKCLRMALDAPEAPAKRREVAARTARARRSA